MYDRTCIDFFYLQSKVRVGYASLWLHSQNGFADLFLGFVLVKVKLYICVVTEHNHSYLLIETIFYSTS